MKKHFLIDFENVGDEGLNGFFDLNNDDIIDLFFTDKSNKIKIDFIDKYLKEESKPILNFIKVSYGPQALDLQLSSYLGSIIAKDNDNEVEYMIVSKDKGYDHVIEFWKNLNSNIKVNKCKNLIPIIKEEIKETKEEKKEEIVDIIKEENTIDTKPVTKAKTKSTKKETPKKDKSLINNQVQQILGKNKYQQDTIAYCSSKATSLCDKKDGNMKINQDFVQKFGQEEGDKIYSLIKEVLKK